MINNMNINDITTLRVFKAVFETRSLTASASQMGLSKPAISKRLDALEVDLGFKLFSRTTRSVTPTQNANNLILQVGEIIRHVDALNTELSSQGEIPKKKIRVTCISSMAQRFVGRILKSYQKDHPEIEVELIVTDSVLDPIEYNIDLSIRVNPAKNSSLVGKKMGDYKLVAVATPEYLKKYSKIKKVEDLQQHDLLLIEQHMVAFSSMPKDLIQRLKGKRSFTTNDSPLIYQLVLAGDGVGIRSSWDVKESLQKKHLVLALPETSFEPKGDIWLVSTKDRLQANGVRDLYEHLIKNISPYLN
jgi:LysR family transcriptional activator of dmlA